MVGPSCPKKAGERKKQRPTTFGSKKTFFHSQWDLSERLAKTESTQSLTLLNPVTPSASAAANRHGRHRPPQPSQLADKVLGTGRLPKIFIRVILARFRLTDADVGSFPIKLHRGGGIHAFLGRLTAEAAQVPSLERLTLIEVERYVGAHILQSFFSVPVGPYDPYHWLFGCIREIPSEGIPAIVDIPVASFAEQRVVSAVSQEDHIVYMEGVSPSSCRTKPCEIASCKAEG